MRPLGSYGPVALAMRDAAQHGPATVRGLAERAQVGYRAARVTASRLVQRGDLVVLDGAARPAVLAAPQAVPPAGDGLATALDALHRSFWARPSMAAPLDVEDEPDGM